MNRSVRRLLSLISLSLLIAGLPLRTQAQIAFDDFDSSLNLLSRTITPDLSGSGIPGTFPGSRFDVFGLVDRTVNFDFADDSAGSFPADAFGLLFTGKTDHVFGVEDLTNPDNPGGTGTAVWTFDIAGFTALSLHVNFAAMGDFEDSNDIFSFSASIDGGPVQALFTSDVREDLSQTYTLESGTNVDLPDPLAINGTVLSNLFQTLNAAIAGEGSVLTLTFSAASDGGSEVTLFDNIRIDGRPAAVPEPGVPAFLAGSGMAGWIFLARRRKLS